MINKERFAKTTIRKAIQKERAPRCNHCGGLVRASGEINSCIMCTRISGHQCEHCAYGQPA